MTQKVFIPGKLPDLNSLLKAAKLRRGQWSAYADIKREWTSIIVAHVRQEKLQPAQHPVFIRYYWWEANKRRDLDGISSAGRKLINDALVQAGILPNDNWKWVLGFSDEFAVKKSKPGVLVVLEEREY